MICAIIHALIPHEPTEFFTGDIQGGNAAHQPSQLKLPNANMALPLTILTTTFLLILTSPHCHAHPHLIFSYVSCGEENPPAFVVPKLADCRVVLQHLPAIAEEDNNNLYRLTPALTAFPFIPPLNIRHGSCEYAFTFQHASGHVARATPQLVPMNLVWSVMRVGAQRIADECQAERQFGQFMALVEDEDEGMTTISVSNSWTTHDWRGQAERMWRARERLGMGRTASFYEDARAPYDFFQEKLFEV